jgi:hypothetical protein
MSQTERRHDPRRRCSDPIWWRAEQRDEHRVGWLLERSSQGAAFVVRDAWPPNVTDLLEVHVWHGPDGRRPGRGFVVHRVKPIHADMYLVAGRFAPLEEGAARAAEASEAVGVGVCDAADPQLAESEMEARPMPAEAPAAIWQG